MHLKSCDADTLAKLRAREITWQEVARGSGWAELRDGCIDMAAVFDELRKSGYDGWLMVEQDNSPNSCETAAANNCAFLREVV